MPSATAILIASATSRSIRSWFERFVRPSVTEAWAPMLAMARPNLLAEATTSSKSPPRVHNSTAG